ncbi:MAG: hypothetical protein IKL44_07515 [Clostridia bacterium]|nr:hypothetical protein [Clostridia bacterium]MBR3594498.1 hypothetical protein [Clostridia bacterium]
MDNSRYYNDSLAYDFDMFLPKEKPQKAKIVKMPQTAKKQASRRAAATAVGKKVKAIAVIGFILAVICANIFLRVRITEVNSQISDIKGEITELQSEQTRLNVEFENRISYENLEQQAAALGMSKTDKSQVIYIRTNDTNAAVTSDGVFSAATN